MRNLALTLLLFFGLSAFATDELIVTEKSGQTSYSISTVKELSFDGKGIKISFNDNTSAYFAKETLTMIKFNASMSGINEIGNNEASINLKGNTIYVTGDACDIKVFALDGTIVAQSHGNTLNISNISNGTYIVNAGSLISKIIKR